MKIGLEVEGRKQGIKTLFVDAYSEIAPDEINALRQIADLKLKHRFTHVYISDRYRRIVLREDNEFLKELFKMGLSITVERYVVYKYEMKKIPVWVDIFLNVQDKSFWFLRPTDQIKFSKDLTVFSEMKGKMALTLPEDFDKDIDV